MRFPFILFVALAFSTSAEATAFPNCAAAEKDFSSSESGVVLFKPYDVKSSASIGNFVTVMKQVKERLAAQDTKLVMLIPPLRAMAFTPEESGLSTQEIEDAKMNYSHYLKSIRAAGLEVVDLSNLSGFKSEMNGFFLKSDHHWSPEGARYAAQITASVFQLPRDEAVSFTTTKGPTTLFGGGYLAQLQQRCGFTAPREQWEMIQTYTTNESGTDLLGDEVADVVIVGDSFVAGPWNFTGFLEQALQRRVANFAVSGGGVFASMIRYLQSSPATAPKVILWEIFKVNLDGEQGGGNKLPMQFRANTRLLLGSFNNCIDPRAVTISESKGGFTTSLRSEGKILKLNFASNSIGDFTLTLNGTGKPTPMLVSRQYKVETDKTFQFELTSDDLVGITSVTIAGETLNGPVSVGQCQ